LLKQGFDGGATHCWTEKPGFISDLSGTAGSTENFKVVFVPNPNAQPATNGKASQATSSQEKASATRLLRQSQENQRLQ
jgi:hypothetical protein